MLEPLRVRQVTEILKYNIALGGTAMARSLPVMAVYVTFCLVWAGFAYWIVPSIIAAADAGKIPSILKSFQGGSSSPVELHIGGWSVISCAVPLAAILHLAIVLFIRAIDRKHPFPPFEIAVRGSRTNLVLFVFSAAFLALCIVSGARGDYVAYIEEWTDILEGRDPWRMVGGVPYNAYGPLFNVLAPLVWISPLANKLLIAFAYLAYVTWLVKDFGMDRGLIPLSWPAIIFWLVNPFPWIEIAIYGHLDLLVALACVAAVHGQVRGKDVFSGACLAIGILLKYLPIVILPFLMFNKRHFRFGLFSSCAILVIAGLFLGTLVWGTSIFGPLMFAAGRRPIASIYEFLSAIPPLHLLRNTPNLNWLEKPIWLTAGLSVFIWSIVSPIGPAFSAVLAVLVTLLFYRVGYTNYQMVLFLLISYWAVSRWQQLKEHCVLAAFLVGYFAFLAAVDMAIWLGLEGYNRYSMVVVLLKFLLGCALLASLIQFSSRQDA
jgi:hypothetical protein